MRYLILMFSFFTVLTATAQNFTPDAANSTVQFTIDNLGFAVKGSFSGLSGAIVFEAKNISAASFNVSVAANTINTSNAARDKHLRGEDYFFVSKFEQITITSTKIAKSVTPGYLVFFGKLTLKGVTKDISFPFKVSEENGTYRFTGDFKMKRRDFGVGGRSTLSNELTVKLNVLTKKT